MRKVMAITAVIIALAFTALSLTGCEQPTDSVTLIGISTAYNGSAKIHPTKTVDELKDDLIVTAHYSDGSAKTLSPNEYTLSVNDGALTVGTPVITVSYGGRTATFIVIVTVPQSDDIDYSVVQTGGIDDVADSTGIKFTFSESVDGFALTAANITVGEKAAKGATATLTGAGTTWTLSPITVTHAGQATVQITKPGIDADIMHVTVYKAGEFAPTLTGITVTYNSTATIYQTTPLNDLKAGLTVKAQYSDDSEETLSASEYILSGTLTVGTSTITVIHHEDAAKTGEFTVTVECDHDYEWEEIKPATVTEDGAATGICRVCGEPGARTLYATGTAGLNYELIDNNTAYRVNRGAKAITSLPTLHIPAYWRASPDAEYLPVTEVGTSNNTSAFGGGSSSVTSSNNTLTELTFAKNSRLTTIGAYAFRSCDKLISVTIPEGVRFIGDDAFRGTGHISFNKLASITIPASVEYIGDGAFNHNIHLAGITLNENNQHYTCENGIVYDKAKTKIVAVPMGIAGTITIPATVINVVSFNGCINITGVTIPEGAKTIGNGAFRGCTSLATITIPEGVTSIGNSAFYECSSLTGVIIPASVKSIGDYAFSGDYTSRYVSPSSLTSVTISEGVTTIGNNAFALCAKLTSVTIPASVTTIGSYAFSGCSALAGVTISAGVKTIGARAFEGCTSLTSVTIPEGVTSIGSYAFEGCTSLTGVTILEGVTSIGNYTFSKCSALTSVTIPASVESIAGSAFSGCTSLTNITIAAGNPYFTYEDGILYNKNKTTVIAYLLATGSSVTIPEGVTSISTGAFSGRTGLTSVTIPSSVTTIGDRAFYECTNLTSVTITEGVKTIGQYAFSACYALTSVTIPSSVTTIGNSAFNAAGLFSVTISEGVKTIGDYAFRGSRITSLTIPASVESIGQAAFIVCTSLTSVNISAASIGEYAFQNCISLANITIGANVKSIGYAAFSYTKELSTIPFLPDGTVPILPDGTINGSVTFEGTIPSTGFHVQAFVGIGNLRPSFYAEDPANGTPGKYKATNVNNNIVWTWQALED